MTPWMLHRSRSTASAARGPLSSFAIPLSFFSSFFASSPPPAATLVLSFSVPSPLRRRMSAGLSEHTAAEDRVHAPAAGTAAAAVAAGELVGVLRPPSLLFLLPAAQASHHILP